MNLHDIPSLRPLSNFPAFFYWNTRTPPANWDAPLGDVVLTRVSYDIGVLRARMLTSLLSERYIDQLAFVVSPEDYHALRSHPVGALGHMRAGVYVSGMRVVPF